MLHNIVGLTMLLNVVSFSLMYATIRDPDRLLSRQSFIEPDQGVSEHPLMTLLPYGHVDDDFSRSVRKMTSHCLSLGDMQS